MSVMIDMTGSCYWSMPGRCYPDAGDHNPPIVFAAAAVVRGDMDGIVAVFAVRRHVLFCMRRAHRSRDDHNSGEDIATRRLHLVPFSDPAVQGSALPVSLPRAAALQSGRVPGARAMVCCESSLNRCDLAEPLER